MGYPCGQLGLDSTGDLLRNQPTESSKQAISIPPGNASLQQNRMIRRKMWVLEASSCHQAENCILPLPKLSSGPRGKGWDTDSICHTELTKSLSISVHCSCDYVLSTYLGLSFLCFLPSSNHKVSRYLRQNMPPRLFSISVSKFT